MRDDTYTVQLYLVPCLVHKINAGQNGTAPMPLDIGAHFCTGLELVRRKLSWQGHNTNLCSSWHQDWHFGRLWILFTYDIMPYTVAIPPTR